MFRRRMKAKPALRSTALVPLRKAFSAGSAETSVAPAAGVERPRSRKPTPRTTSPEVSPMTRVGARIAGLSLPAHAVQQPALSLGRPAEPGSPNERRRLAPRPGRRRGREVLVEDAGLGRRAAPLAQGPDDQVAPPLAEGDAQPVLEPDGAGRLRRLAVDVHLPALAGGVSQAACLVEAGRPQPAIEPDGFAGRGLGGSHEPRHFTAPVRGNPGSGRELRQ